MKSNQIIKIIVAALLFCVLPTQSQTKREFRGAWIQCVNGQFQGLGPAAMQRTLLYQLDELQKDGVNAIIFQVRPECDALYQSSYEPWSRFLTGTQGMPPSPYWDPLQWMIDECHKRGMELHAWINPFRAKTKVTHELSNSHIASRRPDLVFQYDGLYILNPAKQEARDYICQVTADIVKRYDVDGLHIDDYFYPYPAAGQQIPDVNDFHANPRGYNNINDWRRDNVNLFIEQLYKTIRSVKPWVKFGVSPFGIYQNKSAAHPGGSNTHGLQNYDELYADVLLWVEKGWLDYCVPQIYWEIGHKAADYQTLIYWWTQNSNKRPLFIGEDVERTVKFNQQSQKRQLYSQLYGTPSNNSSLSGTVLWYAKAAVDNVGGYGTQLRNNYWRKPALQPSMPFISKATPKKVRKVKPIWTSDGYVLFWKAPKAKGWENEATKYVVYRFENKEKIDISDASHIVAITATPWYRLPYENGKNKYVYVVTALNRLDNESSYVKKKVKL